MCKLCEIIGDILPRGKTVIEDLVDRILIITYRKSNSGRARSTAGGIATTPTRSVNRTSMVHGADPQ
jgi:hypothetical protein